MTYRVGSLFIFFALVFVVAQSADKSAISGGNPGDKPKKAGERIPLDSSTQQDLIKIISSAGDKQQQANDRIRTMNRGMRSNYARTLADVTARINPVIVAQFDGVGGTFNLRDGKRFVKVQPVPETYELAKSVAHAPLDIYMILAPYFTAPQDGLWQKDLGVCGKKIKSALDRLNDCALNGEARANARIIMSESLTFIDRALANKNFTLDDYRDYSKKIFPSVAALRYFATNVQMRAIIAQLEQWRDEMGKERWRDLSAVVITPFTLSEETPALQCLRYVMDPDRVKHRLINIGGDYGKEVDRAISVFGRLYLDGLAAKLAFAQNSPLDQEMTKSLSSKRDLMAVPAKQVLRKIIEERQNRNEKPCDTNEDQSNFQNKKTASQRVRDDEAGHVSEYNLAWPSKAKGSTHEIAYDPNGGKALWITGMNHDCVARIGLDGRINYFPMPTGSRPHGILFDAAGQLWVSLEYLGTVARLDKNGKIAEQIDVRIYAKGAAKPINPHPHGLGLDPDGKTIWFTGKKTSTVGKINPDGAVQHFELANIGAMPIYIAAGPDGNMWCTELIGNSIARISPKGEIKEFAIPTPNSRPIAIVVGPDKKSMWFSQEASNNVARIDLNGNIKEYPVPMTQKNVILAGLAFDREGNLWTHSYVDRSNPLPTGSDHIIRIDKAINTAPAGDHSKIPVTYYKVPTKNAVMHRILLGPDNNIWFTELGADKVGKLTLPSGKR